MACLPSSAFELLSPPPTRRRRQHLNPPLPARLEKSFRRPAANRARGSSRCRVQKRGINRARNLPHSGRPARIYRRAAPNLTRTNPTNFFPRPVAFLFPFSPPPPSRPQHAGSKPASHQHFLLRRTQPL